MMMIMIHDDDDKDDDNDDKTQMVFFILNIFCVWYHVVFPEFSVKHHESNKQGVTYLRF